MDTLCLKINDGMHLVRQSMIKYLSKKGISSGAVLDAMAHVPRHLFVSEALRYRAYDDISLPIGFGQTISRPSVIARMVQSLSLTGIERVLEIGTGSGYQSAVLAELAGTVVTIERIGELAQRARDILTKMNYINIHSIHSEDFADADGLFDAIIVAAGADILPVELFTRLNNSGVLVIPVGNDTGHSIKRFVKRENGTVMEENIGEAVFVPLIRNTRE